MEKEVAQMGIEELAAAGFLEETTRYKLRTELLMGDGKRKKMLFNNIAPGLDKEQLQDKLYHLSQLRLLGGEAGEQMVEVRKITRIEQLEYEVFDHAKDGRLLQERRLSYLDELCFEHCKINRLSVDHLNQDQQDAIANYYWPFVLEKYPEKKPRSQRIENINPAPIDTKKAMSKYAFDELQFPTLKELTQGSIWKACAMLKDFFSKGGDRERFVEGVRAIQLRTEWSNSEYYLMEEKVFRHELETIYGERKWHQRARELFQPLVELVSELARVQLVAQVQNEERTNGLEQIGVTADEPQAKISLSEKLAQLQEAAQTGGLNACGV